MTLFSGFKDYQNPITSIQAAMSLSEQARLYPERCNVQGLAAVQLLEVVVLHLNQRGGSCAAENY